MIALKWSQGKWSIESDDMEGPVSIFDNVDWAKLVSALDTVLKGNDTSFTRSDGAEINVYWSKQKKDAIVIERSGGNWVRISGAEAVALKNFMGAIVIASPESERERTKRHCFDKCFDDCKYGLTASAGKCAERCAEACGIR